MDHELVYTIRSIDKYPPNYANLYNQNYSPGDFPWLSSNWKRIPLWDIPKGYREIGSQFDSKGNPLTPPGEDYTALLLGVLSMVQEEGE